jgi:propionyl-CoA synthetase
MACFSDFGCRCSERLTQSRSNLTTSFAGVVGHSFCVYSPLLVGCASVIFEGKRRRSLSLQAQGLTGASPIFDSYPSRCGHLLEEYAPLYPSLLHFFAHLVLTVVETYKVTCLSTAPTALRAIRREDPDAKLMARYDLSSLRSLFLAGERSEPGIITRYQELLNKLAAPGAIVNDKFVGFSLSYPVPPLTNLVLTRPASSSYWSTESGSPITAIQLNTAFPPLAPRPGSAGLPLPGMDVRIVDDEGNLVKRGEMGNIVLAQPLPPSALGTIWNSEDRFQEYVRCSSSPLRRPDLRNL